MCKRCIRTSVNDVSGPNTGARPYRVQCRVERCDWARPLIPFRVFSRVSRAPHFLRQSEVVTGTQFLIGLRVLCGLKRDASTPWTSRTLRARHSSLQARRPHVLCVAATPRCDLLCKFLSAQSWKGSFSRLREHRSLRARFSPSNRVSACRAVSTCDTKQRCGTRTGSDVLTAPPERRTPNAERQRFA